MINHIVNECSQQGKKEWKTNQVEKKEKIKKE